MKKSYTYLLLLSCFFSYAQEFQILAPSDNSVTTHKLSSGDEGFQIGITSNGGGVVNFVNLPGKGDIMKLASDRYGRAGQLAFRDASHGGSYNPTQAGYNEDLGTKCRVLTKTKKLIVPQRGMALWFGDNRYDFTEWENIGDDSKDSDGGNSDKDGLDESNLPGRQEAEVLSEFDYYGIYEDVFGENDIQVATVRHYFEASFVREPGHCINQFREGTPMFNANALRREIKRLAPQGSYPGTDKDLNGVIAVWSLRNDVSRWDFKYIYLKNASGDWVTLDATANIPASYNQSVFILAESNDSNTGRALCLYKPNSEINKFPIVGINEDTGTIAYKDDRIRLSAEGTKITYDKFRAPSMSKYGFSNRFSGMINRNRLESNIYEMYRGEYFIAYGTPQKIMDNLSKISNLKNSQHISFQKLESKKIGDPDFYPTVNSDSRLPITLTSSDTNVADIVNGKIVLKSPGVTTITASQPGNNLFLAAPTSSQQLVVESNSENQKPMINIITPNDGDVFELGEEIIITVDANDPEGNLDKVNFKINGNFYKTDTTKPYQNTFIPSETGTFVIGARAFDSEGLSEEVTVTINVIQPNRAPDIELIAPTDGSVFNLGEEIILSANASDPDGNLDKVNFKINGNFYRSDSTSPFTDKFTPTQTGIYIIGARAFDQNSLSTEKTVTIEIIDPNLSNQDIWKNKKSEQIIIYPNPTSETITINGLENEMTTIEIIDIYGKVIKQTKINISNNTIPVTALSEGIYFVHLTVNNKKFTKGFVKK